MGQDEAAVRLYIQQQEKEDQHLDQLGLFGSEGRLERLQDYPPWAVCHSSVRLCRKSLTFKSDIRQRILVELQPGPFAAASVDDAVERLARELRKTQRRCNALSKIFIPSYRETLAYISGTLEERERESLTILKIIRDRLAQPFEETASH